MREIAGGMGRAGQRVQYEDRIAFVSVQRAVGFVGKGDGSQLVSRGEHELVRGFGEVKMFRPHNAD